MTQMSSLAATVLAVGLAVGLTSFAAAEQADGPESSQEKVLLARIAEALVQPELDAAREDLRSRLLEMIGDTSELAVIADEPELQLEAYSLHMQALHGYIAAFPEDPRVGTYRGRLRATAERTAHLADPQAEAVGDFWQLTADLIDIRLSEAEVAEKREQMAPLLRAYLREHEDHPAGYAARQMLRELEAAAAGEAVDAGEDEAAVEAEGEAEAAPGRPAFVLPFDLDDDAGEEAEPAEDEVE
ncbi:MAG: hypothetical protein WD294_00725 [Phycisphaeraceae bacterium]